MQLSDDIAALLNSKIREFEQGSLEKTEKAQRLQKGKAKSTAKTKTKEAKVLAASSDLPASEKAEKLFALLQAEHDACDGLVLETGSATANLDTPMALAAVVRAAEEERDAIKVELSRSLAVNTKLESLCRKLQQEASKLVDIRRDLTEKERQQRQELANEFQHTIADLKLKIDQQANERFALAHENEDLRNRFKQLFEQYDRSEKELAEHQTTQAAEARSLQERLTEQSQLCHQEVTREAAARRFNDELTGSEKELRDQLATYTEKLGQFQGSLSKSDKVLAKYRQHRSKSQRRVEVLEKENKELRARNEKKVAVATKDRDAVLREKAALQERCKALQNERQRLLEEQAKLQ